MENLSDEKWLRFEKLLSSDLKTAEVWALKENFRWFRDYKHAGSARKFFEEWELKVAECGEAALQKVSEMIRRHLPELLTYLKHRVTNAVSEGLNTKNCGSVTI